MFGKFSVIRDEETSQIAIVCPAPIVVFETMEELKEWVDELVETVSDINDETTKSSSLPLKQAYAAQVIQEWQILLQKNLKDNGTEK